MNRQIIVAVVFIGGVGVFNAVQRQGKITPIIIGSYVLLLILSIMDMFGGDLSKLAGGLAMVAVVYTLLGKDPSTGKALFPWDSILSVLQQK